MYRKNKITVNQPLNKQMGRILKCEQITDDSNGRQVKAKAHIDNNSNVCW